MVSALQEPLLLLVGPTAVGKTALSLPIAQALDAEIVNVDSRQIYRHMDIGTAKPSAAEQAQVPHHLLDLLLPDQPTNAAQFLLAARAVLAALQQRGKRALIVAGSGLYVQALLSGLMPAPAAYEPLRRVLRLYADRYGTPALHRRLQCVDPAAAASYHPHDRIRVVRALEVTYLTGEPFSRHRQRHQDQVATAPYIGIAFTRERSDLYARIAARTDAMLAAGWLTEVEQLVQHGYRRNSGAMHSLGYRELLAYLAGTMSWPETVTAIKQATCQLAKRQLTWFRKMPHLHWINLSTMPEPTAVSLIVQRLQAGLVGAEPASYETTAGEQGGEDQRP
ncbi:MAG: tRNA (adenosine(37)-N6)-dimethylallyltransferase MiaA [Candidatus Tectomicrobia bacterium]|uniref:tRNA dimethylallyltransferase n=1 Tax=Tectimicrobiota bacterium TaxID=2528274 RepID=A0A937W1Z0_UNCTE|nr:tRNA (adenosine(37)-N6)-dimethylallyltransferase MiaA [Candidatus Tectomicrobia bacterium]